MQSTDDAWREWGRRDPYFAVITNPKFRQATLGEAELKEFFRSGERHVEHLAAMMRRLLGGPEFAPARALDFGCGVGRVTLPLARLAGEVVGVDVSEAMLEQARRHAEAAGVANARFVLSDDTLSQVEGRFDLVHSFIVLQHIDVERGRAFFRELVERVAPGGCAALHVTYAKTEHAARYGQPSPQEPSSTFGARLRRLVRRLRPAPPPPTGSDPQMQMNCYPMNDLLFILQTSGVPFAHVQFTDHGGELGVVIFFKRPGAPRR